MGPDLRGPALNARRGPATRVRLLPKQLELATAQGIEGSRDRGIAAREFGLARPAGLPYTPPPDAKTSCQGAPRVGHVPNQPSRQTPAFDGGR